MYVNNYSNMLSIGQTALPWISETRSSLDDLLSGTGNRQQVCAVTSKDDCSIGRQNISWIRAMNNIFSYLQKICILISDAAIQCTD